jgi:acetyl-CoA C-acetyltransferase
MAIQTTTGLAARLVAKRAAFPASRRNFSASRSALKDIQEAYILSGARTPTAKVKLFTDHPSSSSLSTNDSFSSTDRLYRYPLPNWVQLPSSLP